MSQPPTSGSEYGRGSEPSGQDPNASGGQPWSQSSASDPYGQQYGQQSQQSASDPYSQQYGQQSQSSASDPYAQQYGQQSQQYGQSQQSASDPYASYGQSQQSASDPYAQPQYDQQPGYAVQGYPAQPYGYAQAVLPDHPQSTTALILGILSFFTGGITGPFAWYIGGKARKQVQANPGQYKDGGMLTVGWVLGIVGTIYLAFFVLFVVVYLVIIVAILGAGAASGY